MSNDPHGLDTQAIEDMRHFNRFYTRQLGLLDEGLLDSVFSLTEARVLFELEHAEDLTATAIGRELGLDAGYLSRLLKRFESQGLLTREVSGQDSRQAVLRLTPAGYAAYAPLNQASQAQIAALLSELVVTQREKLLEAMRTIQNLLGEPKSSSVPYILRPHQVGDMGWIVHRQGLLYAQEYGWDETYEALVAEIVAGFVKNFDPKWERCWIAEREGRIAGSVFVLRETPTQAKLRLLYVEPEARGLGIGQRLVEECIRFARQKGYRRLVLWTNDILLSARKIYQVAGFRLLDEEAHHSFGKDLVGQHWGLDL
ncbi:bifunctional helix-turn-helix transcriptional regulator/GNAT family N-acetyltransferase [Uliginosibacterium gangwonense]|uniref:bifunctional helix-turn-helix transcriptional regulator/GNAT family N-acetyltransferase n=1 Tax=Uliginosibacterium gangwonense TaxID=392736 RepID=UPI00037D858D|nr:helix-turn-helix domain-containing GNAT family N-acetyltransferase [Uliginosibacterium gangwonense]